MDGTVIEYDDALSFKDFTHWEFHSRPEYVFDGKVIYASIFLHEVPDQHIFPEDMKNVTFVNCNLDNVFVPDGALVIGGSRRRFKVQNDKEDWIVDNLNNPIEPVNVETFVTLGISTDPSDIPTKELEEPLSSYKRSGRTPVEVRTEEIVVP